ncbi:MAG: NUDIX domain-containing protein [Candidatus Zixiibacteriota bacterium]
MSSRKSIEIESPGINVAVVKKEKSGWKFLMLRRAPSESYPGFWGFLTGGRENNETVPQLALRELKEETGLTAESLWATEYVFQFYEPTVDKIWLLPVLVAVVPADTTVKLSAENSECRWLVAGEAINLAPWKSLKQIAENIAEELSRYPAENWIKLES